MTGTLVKHVKCTSSLFTCTGEHTQARNMEVRPEWCCLPSACVPVSCVLVSCVLCACVPACCCMMAAGSFMKRIHCQVSLRFQLAEKAVRVHCTANRKPMFKPAVWVRNCMTLECSFKKRIHCPVSLQFQLAESSVRVHCTANRKPMFKPGTAVRTCMNVARRARVAGPTPPRHMGPTHPPANRPLQKTNCTQDCVGVNACIHLQMDMNIILSCASHACNMEVRPRTGSGTDTGTQAHGEEHRSTFFLRSHTTL